MALWIGLEIYLTKVGEQVAHFVERIWAMGETGGKEESERGEEGGTNKQAARERERERKSRWTNDELNKYVSTDRCVGCKDCLKQR